MLRNYFTVAFRHLAQKKIFSLISILGLAIGIAASLLIIHYVRYELSYDDFHQQSDRIYRVQYNNYQNGRLTFECAAAVPAVGPAMKDKFPVFPNWRNYYLRE